MNRLISLVRIGLALTWTLLLALPVGPVLLLLWPSRRARIVVSAWYGRALAGGALAVLGIRPVYEHAERLPAAFPAIYVANHSSNADPFLAMWHNPIGAVGIAKREIALIPVYGLMYLLSGHLLIHRADRHAAVQAFADVAALVARHGLGLYIWPEGTMPKDGRLLPFKKGFVHLALATRLPIVPIVVHDAHLRWPARTLTVHPGAVRVEILPPIETRHWSHEDVDRHCEQVRQRFLDHLAPHQHPLPVSAT